MGEEAEERVRRGLRARGEGKVGDEKVGRSRSGGG